MNGLIMDYGLNIPSILRRGEQLFGRKEIVTRLPDKSFHRYTYADFGRRAKRLGSAFRNAEPSRFARRPKSAYVYRWKLLSGSRVTISLRPKICSPRRRMDGMFSS